MQRHTSTKQKTPKSLQIADLSDDVRGDATHRVSSGGGTRRGPVFYGKRAPFPSAGAKSGVVPDDLLWVIEAWPNLESKVREAVVALVKISFKGPKNDSSSKSSTPY